MRLRSIEISNYQSIAHALLELDDWTSLVGTSDVGKSACLRALYGLLTNQRGDHFVRQGATSCKVLVTRDDGLSVEWIKARGKSGTYIVSLPTADPEVRDGQVYDRTAGEIPPEVAAALPMLVEIDGQPFMPGFQRQHERPFMFGDTPRWRAQALGEFDGTNVLLLAETRIRREQRTAQGIVSAQSDRATALVAELEALAFVPELEKALEAAQSAQDAREAAQARFGSMHTTASLLGIQAASEAALVAQLAAADAQLTEAGDWQLEVKRLRFKIDGMTALLAPLEVDLPELPDLPDLNELQQAYMKVHRLRAVEVGLVERGQEISRITLELATVLADLEEFQVCPTCGRVLA